MGCFREFTRQFGQFILFFLNFIILVAALILLVFAVKLKTDNGRVDLTSVGSFAIGVAVLIALIAFFGCCGAIRKDSCMLTTYAAICLTLCIIQLVLGILAFVAIKNGSNELDKEVHKILDKLYMNISKKDDALEIEGIQRNLECCGRTGVNDATVKNGSFLIDSCCKPDIHPCSEQEAFKKNCFDEMTMLIANSIKGIGVIAIVFAVIELLSAALAFYVRNNIGLMRCPVGER